MAASMTNNPDWQVTATTDNQSCRHNMAASITNNPDTQVMATTDNHSYRKYSLNKVKSLHKKRNHCDRPFINLIPRDSGRQLKIECSTGCYEILKKEMTLMMDNKDLSDEFSIVFTPEIIKDQHGNSPELIIRAFNKLSSGAPGKRKKMTINMYHTQCSLLINGNYAPTFHDEILPRIISNLESNPNLCELDKMFANIIDRGLKQSINNPDCETSIKALPTDCDLISDPPSPANESKPTDLETCPHCETKVDDGIACDNCLQWFHFNCEHLDRNFKEFYQEGDMPYSCLSCRQLTAFHEDLLTSIPDMSVISSNQDAITTLQSFDQREEGSHEPQIFDVNMLDLESPLGNDHTENPPDFNLTTSTGQIDPVQTAVKEQEIPCNLPQEIPISDSSKVPNKDNNHPECKNQPKKNAAENTKKKKKQDQPSLSELRQQLELSLNVITNLETKVEELDRQNKLLHLQKHNNNVNMVNNHPMTNGLHTSQGFEPQFNLHHLPGIESQNNLHMRIMNLENDMLRSRLNNLELVQQLNSMRMTECMNRLHHNPQMRQGFLPTFTQGHAPAFYPPNPNVHHSHIIRMQHPSNTFNSNVNGNHSYSNTNMYSNQNVRPVSHPLPKQNDLFQSTRRDLHTNVQAKTFTVTPTNIVNDDHRREKNTERQRNYQYSYQQEHATDAKAAYSKPRAPRYIPPRFQKQKYIHPVKRHSSTEKKIYDLHSTPKKVRFEEDGSTQPITVVDVSNVAVTHESEITSSSSGKIHSEHIPVTNGNTPGKRRLETNKTDVPIADVTNSGNNQNSFLQKGRASERVDIGQPLGTNSVLDSRH